MPYRKPSAQPNCLEVERGLFSQESETRQGHFSGMLMAFAYVFVDLLKGKGESPHVFCTTGKVINQLVIYIALILPGMARVLVYFALPRKPFIIFY